MARVKLLLVTGAFLALAVPGSVALSQKKAAVPKFEVDPWWPKPLPEGWITGRLGSVCIDSHDHVIVTNRRDITDEEKETSKQAPSVLIFDLAGTLIGSWDGDWDKLPGVIHGCYADKDNNIWITGNGDGIIQKYTHNGELLLDRQTRRFRYLRRHTQGQKLECESDSILQPGRRCG